MTTIEWTQRPGTRGETWNPLAGCSIHSPGCTNCYAMRMAHRIQAMGGAGAAAYAGTTKVVNGNPVWTGRVNLAPGTTVRKPLRWRQPRTVFVNSMSDLFHEDVPDRAIDRIFAVMALSPQHTFIVLTKRSARMREYVRGIRSPIPFLGKMPLERIHMEAAGHMEGDGGFMDVLKQHGNIYSLYLDTPWPLPNVWLGVSAERQQEADERIPDLLATPAAVRLVSAEPLLGPLYIEKFLHCTGMPDCEVCEHGGRRIDWIIVGGESGPGARPMHPAWARSIRDQCDAAGVPFFFKQWGAWGPITEGPAADEAAWQGRGEWRVLGRDGALRKGERRWPDAAAGEEGVVKLGKSRAGRLLDGVEHNAFPEAQS